MNQMKRKLALLLMLVSVYTFAQNEEVIQNFLNDNKDRLSLTQDDIQDWTITNEIYSESQKYGS